MLSGSQCVAFKAKQVPFIHSLSKACSTIVLTKCPNFSDAHCSYIQSCNLFAQTLGGENDLILLCFFWALNGSQKFSLEKKKNTGENFPSENLPLQHTAGTRRAGTAVLYCTLL